MLYRWTTQPRGEERRGGREGEGERAVLYRPHFTDEGQIR